MIRRDWNPDRQPAAWLLISQVVHAQLAARLAEYWVSPALAPAEARDELLAAIAHHDDGWHAWEEHPAVDPRSGRPRNFTEMPLDQGLTIWQASIARCATIGPLAAYAVSGHFAALLERFDHWRSAGADEQTAGQEFLDQQRQLRAEWLAQWLGEDDGRTEDDARRALGWLQFFDALSLWLCCAERHDPETFELPGGDTIAFSPLSPQRIVVQPWPWLPRRLLLEAAAQSVPRSHYADADALSAAPHEPYTLRWQLLGPATEGHGEPIRAGKNLTTRTNSNYTR